MVLSSQITSLGHCNMMRFQRRHTTARSNSVYLFFLNFFKGQEAPLSLPGLVSNHLLLSSLETSPNQRHHTSLERIQRRTTRFILNDFCSDYRTRLISLHLLPLMYLYELLDVMFFVKYFKSPDPSFPIWDYVSFSTASTRSASAAKLNHKSRSSTISRHAYFCRLVRIWNTPSYQPLSFPLYN